MARADIYSPNYKKDERYSDFLLSFNKNPSTGNLGRVINEQSVKQALTTLILTSKGERFYNPNIGSKVKSSLFDPADAMTAQTIRESITESITYYEPRVNLISVEIADDPDNDRYKINIFFNLINIPDVLQLDLILKRVR